MLSRIFWVGLAGLALVIGMVIQDGDRMLAWGHDTEFGQDTERAIVAGIERSVTGSFDKMQVIDSEGREIDVPPQTRREFGVAVGRLVKAETDLAVLKIRDGSDQDMRAAEASRDGAKAEVDRLKAAIKGEEQPAAVDQNAIRDQVRSEIREEIRTEIRQAIRN